jgi:hypothetical protein
MTDTQTGMHGHIALGLRLVYEADPAMDQAHAAWTLVGILPDVQFPESLESLESAAAGGGGRRRSVTQAVGLTLDRDEAEGYYLNLTSPQPSLFVLLRQTDVSAAAMAPAPGPGALPEAEAVTASYNEAARWMDGGMVVIRTALPAPMLAWIAEFAQHHYPAEGKKRGKFRPSFLTRRQFGEAAKAAHEEAGSAAAEVAHGAEARPR